MLVLIPIIGPPLATVTAYIGWQIMLGSVAMAVAPITPITQPIAKIATAPIILPLMLLGSGFFALAF